MKKVRPLSKIRTLLLSYVDERTAEQMRDVERHRDEATRLRHLEWRSAIVDMYHRKGMSLSAITQTTGLAPDKIKWYLDWALERVLEMPEEDRKRPRRPRPKTIRGKVVKAISVKPSRSRKKMLALPPGTLKADPNDPVIQKQAFFLRTQAVPVDEIGEILGFSESEANAAIYAYADKLNNSEINTTEVARRVQLEQLDQALRTLMPLVTPREDENGNMIEPNIDHMDRFLKILDQKSKLTGINTPQRINIEHRLRNIADEGEFEYEDLEEIYRQILIEFPSLGLTGGKV